MTETRAFQNALNAAVTGVTVVTTRPRGGLVGHTGTAKCHVSDEPPALLIAIRRGEPLAVAITERGAFAVNVLADHHAALAETFKGPEPTFDVKHWWPFGSLPLLQGAAARFECRVERVHEHGSHVL